MEQHGKLIGKCRLVTTNDMVVLKLIVSGIKEGINSYPPEIAGITSI